MTAAEVADRLRAFLVEVDVQATALAPGRSMLTDIVFSHQSGAPRVTGPYALITPLGVRDTQELDFGAYREVQLDTAFRIVEDKRSVVEFGFRIDIYAPGSADVGRLFVAALRSPKQVDLLPLVVREISRAGMAPELVQQHWEDRTNFTVTLAGEMSDEVVIDVVEKGAVEIDGEATKPISRTVPFDKNA